ncbi:MAG: FAD-dependent oxidoreductase [Clostridia bacterium]|nr:FAD-dependent oxidoreductase [Clostridia bacterium]
MLCGGRQADPDINEQAIAEGKIDAAVIGRQAIAAPDYANCVVNGKPEEIRTCIGCNQGCIWGYFCTGRVGCAVNPEVGHEAEKIEKAQTLKKVVIVGGGIAGMEAARVARLSGHAVTLYEKSDVLGGNLIPAGAHDFKVEIGGLTDYYRTQMILLDVDVRLNSEATPDILKAADADVVILAAGSVPVMPRSIDGIDKAVSGVDALLGRKPVGDKVIIVGGGLVGCEIAYGYAKEGKDVTVVEALDQILSLGNVPGMNKAMLLDGFAYYGVKIMTGTKLKRVVDSGAVVALPDGTEQTLEADTVILSVGYRPVPSMKEQLADCAARVIEIGDGRQVGNVLTCVRDAYEAVKNL